MNVAQSCSTLGDPIDYLVQGVLQVRIQEWVAFSLLLGIFPTQESNCGLLHYRQILYQLSYQGSQSGVKSEFLALEADSKLLDH